MQLTGLHHLTLDLRRHAAVIAFYRDVLGLGIVRDAPSDDDPGVRHVWFGAVDGAPGGLISVMEYPTLPRASWAPAPARGFHFALAVDSSEELGAWRDYLRDQGVECTDVFPPRRLRVPSIYGTPTGT